jgi:DNA-binding LacI/PurR family transcriptional regulator
MARIKDVAKEAGVSINNCFFCDERKKFYKRRYGAKSVDAVKKLNYNPIR